jgi:type IV pilus assembly protein PilV
MLKMNKNYQNGVGLMEVLLRFYFGYWSARFSVLQVSFIDASQEASDRSVAMNLARDLSERIVLIKLL